jgi:hypothetical protein
MTAEEHRLMISMLAVQMQLIKALTEALRSKEVLDRGDFLAFQTLIQSNDEVSQAILQDAYRVYLAHAKGLGIDSGVTIPEWLKTEDQP